MYEETNMICPKCGGKIVETDRAFGCGNWREKDGGCKVSLWKESFGHTFTREEAEALFAGEQVGPMHLKFRSGEERDASVVFNQSDNRVRIVYEETGTPLGRNCPVCGADIVESDKTYHCANHKGRDEGCSFIVFKNCFGHIVTPDEMRRMLDGDTTDEVELTFKSGKTATKMLYFDPDENRVRVSFEDKTASE